jgi:hypothetical protein
LIGIALFAILVSQTGWDGIRTALGRIGAWFAVIALIDLAALLCDAGALHAFARVRAKVSYARVFAAQASGLAINRLTPGNALGEPIKVSMLLGHVPESVAVSSVVMFNLATAWCAIATIVLGVPLTLMAIELPPRVRAAAWVASAALVLIALALIALVRRGAIGSLVGVLASAGVISSARAAGWRVRITEIDAEIRGIGGREVRRALLFVAAARAFYIGGTIALMAAAGLPLTAPVVLAMASVGILVTWLTNVLPLGLGLADGTNYALYGALGASGLAGLAYTTVNRARTVVLALLGLCVMAISSLVVDETTETA